MDFSSSAMNPNFLNSTNTFAVSTTSQIPDKNKEKRFYSWHTKQGISAPQDYPTYASQPSPFSQTPNVPPQPTAATPYLQKVSQHQPSVSFGGENTDEASQDGPHDSNRRSKQGRRTNSSSPPHPAGVWPRSQFGTRPHNRQRRTSLTPDPATALNAEANLPPVASIYDNRFTPASPPTTDAPAPTNTPPTLTPTAVKVANFSQNRFPDLIRSLRTYYGPILEPYSGLPESEAKFPDPEIFPREKLDAATLAMVQPMSGAEGGPGPWVRITFAEREAAERAVAGADKGELVVGGRRILVSLWEEDTAVAMDVDEPMTMAPAAAPSPRRNSVGSPGRRGSVSGLRRASFGGDGGRPEMGERATSGAQPGEMSELMPGAKLVPVKPVEFAKKEGWFSSWTNSVVKTANPAGGQAGGWGQALANGYRYVMDDLVGFKHL